MKLFKSDFKNEIEYNQYMYELALKQGKQRFGTECKHKNIKNGHCTKCLRKVTIKL